MKLYHGSTTLIEKIDLSKSLPCKDFGKGFYLSDNYEQAYAMAEFKSTITGLTPVVTTFDFDDSVMKGGHKDFKIKIFESYSEEWAEFVFKNRNNESPDVPVHDYDIIYGPIANDKVGVQIRNYFESNIDLKTFMERLMYMKGITFQYYFANEKSLGLLKRE